MQKAQELTKNSETSVTVYIDPAAVKEVAGGFKGITDSFKALGKLVKEALPKESERVRNSIDNQLSVYDQLCKAGMPPEQARAILEKNAVYADLYGAVQKAAADNGGWDNMSEAAAQKLLDSFTSDPRFAVMTVDSSKDFAELGIKSAKYTVGLLVGISKTLGETGEGVKGSAKATLFYVADYAGFILEGAAGGLVGYDHTQRFNKVNSDLANGIEYLVTQPSAVGSSLANIVKEKWNAYQEAMSRSDFVAAGRLLGEAGTEVALLLAVGGELAAAGLRKASPTLAKLIEINEASKAAEVAKIAEAIKAGEAAKATGFKAPNGSWIYPPNDGFLGACAEEVLSVGTKVDRYGAESGNFLAPKGTPFGQRSLPPDSLNSPYTEYVVVRPLPVQYGKTAPWFGQQGGGTQFKTMHSIEWLIKNKYIKGVVK